MSLLASSNLHALSPLDFGLKTARNGEERFWALYEAHVKAAKTGEHLSYAKVGNLDIEIPYNAKSIPIIWNTDFCGITITVKNNTKDFTLFTYSTQMYPIELDKNDIDGRDFTGYEELKRGIKVLVLRDKTPWVEERKGFTYGASRADVRLLINGKARNEAILPYNNTQSLPSAMYYVTDRKKKSIGNLIFVRDSASLFITRLFDINAVNNVQIKDVRVVTPPEPLLYGDAVITVCNSTNVSLNNINVHGTYSRKDKYGYGISLCNVWNINCVNIKSNVEWGIFCCNNINNAKLNKCDINRFDCHCYGRNIEAVDCVFRDLSNQISSVYGIIRFKRCMFKSFIPLYLRDDYNAYVPFDVEFIQCKYFATSKARTLLYMGGLYNDVNKRPELAEKCWPNVNIKDMEIVCGDNINSVSIFDVNKCIPKDYTVSYISRIKAKNLKVIGEGVTLEISHHPVKTQNSVSFSFEQSGASALIDKGKIVGLVE